MKSEGSRKVWGELAAGIAALAAVLAFASAAQAQQYLFNSATFATGLSPRQVVTGDFNGDGRLDLAVANLEDNDVAIMLGTPAGDFGPATTYATGNGPYAIAVGNFNNDGILDLAVTNLFDDTVSILLGNGNGTFTAGSTIAVGDLPSSIVATQFTSDGNTDLAVTNLGANTVSILLGNGNGTFQTQTTFATGADPRSVAAGDFNGDGHIDLAVADSDANTISILLGNGSGGFTAGTSPATPSLPYWVAVGDFNNDGKLDLAVANNGANNVSVLLGNGDGTFQAHVDTNVGSEPVFVAVANFNADGNADLAIVNSGSNTVTVLLGNGNGTFQPNIDNATGDFPITLVTGDFNSDGKLDLAISNYGADTMTVLLGDGDGTFVERQTTAVGNGTQAIATGNFNAGSSPDLAVANFTDSTVSVLLGNGNGTFTVGSTAATGTGPAGVAVGDFNGDGNPDIATGNMTANTVSVLLGNGNGTFGTHTDFATGIGPTGVAAAPLVTGNTTLDLVVANEDANTVSVLLGNGNGTFQTHTDLKTGAEPVAVAVADFRNDGNMDLAVADFGANAVSILLGNGNGTFQTETAFTTGFEPSGVAVGDFNGDGKLDLATSNNGSVSILLGNGDGTFQKHVDFPTGDATGIAAGDFNGDGKLDVVVSTSTGAGTEGTGAILLGNGNGTLQPEIEYSVGDNPSAVVAGVFDATGSLGFATANFSSASVSVFLDLPMISLYPAAFNFGTVTVGSASSPQTLTVTNPGIATLNISSVAASGNYSETNNCVTNLAPGATCTASITFNPATVGMLTGSLTIDDNSVTSPQTASLTGMGGALTGPAVSLVPSSLNFGNVPVGTTSTAQTAMLTNTGNATLTISSIVASASYSETNTCGTMLSAGANCTISVTFTPGVSGTIPGIVSVTDNAPNSPQQVSLTGVGTAPAVTLQPTSLAFPDQLLNTKSPAETVTLTNTGNGTLTISSIVLSGTSFHLTDNCPAMLGAGANCTLNVVFQPKTNGTQTGTVTITDNAPGSPQTVPLSGAGTMVSFSPPSLTFSTQAVGTSSSPQSITMTNNGTATLSITSITITGANANDFSQTNNCGSSLAGKGTCTIMVTFTPLASGSLSAAVSVADNGGGSPQTAPLTGTGSGTAPVVTLSPTSLSFGNVPVGTTSAPQSVTLSNIGNGTLNITSIVPSANYGQTNTCGSSVSAGGACTISVTFAPTQSGTLTGAVTVTDNATNSPQQVSLTGVGTVPIVTLSPTSLNFGNVPDGTTSAPQNVTLTNTGNAPLNITSITASASYAQTNTCGSSVPAGGNCTISVTFKPTSTGTITGTISVADNATGSPQTVSLTGVGTTAQPVVTLSPTSLNFGNVAVGTTSAAQAVTLTNTGNAALTISSIVASANYGETNTCPASLPATQNCTISVTFTPADAGTITGTITITDNAANSPQQVALTGVGTGGTPAVMLSPTSINFGAELVNTTTPQQTITLTNTGTGILTITGVTVSGQFTLTNNCPSSVNPGANCSILVAFNPKSTGTQNGSVSVADNAAGSPQMVSLTGQGTVVSFSPTSLNFGTVTEGTTSAPQNVTLMNNAGKQALSITGITITGTNMSDFAQTNNCGSSVPAGGTCTIMVTFTPGATGPLSADVSVADNGGGSPQLVPLSGTGQAAGRIHTAAGL